MLCSVWSKIRKCTFKEKRKKKKEKGEKNISHHLIRLRTITHKLTIFIQLYFPKKVQAFALCFFSTNSVGLRFSFIPSDLSIFIIGNKTTVNNNTTKVVAQVSRAPPPLCLTSLVLDSTSSLPQPRGWLDLEPIPLEPLFVEPHSLKLLCALSPA